MQLYKSTDGLIAALAKRVGRLIASGLQNASSQRRAPDARGRAAARHGHSGGPEDARAVRLYTPWRLRVLLTVCFGLAVLVALH